MTTELELYAKHLEAIRAEEAKRTAVVLDILDRVSQSLTPAPSEQSQTKSRLDWLAACALGNPALCTGTAPDYDLRRWFGGRGGVTRMEIAAAQAYDFAAAMTAAGNK